MKFVLTLLLAATQVSQAFVPPTTVQTLTNGAKTAAAVLATPAAIFSVAPPPAFAMNSIIEQLPTQTVALEVQFGAYLAVLLGTFLPVLFLINLFIQTESRKAGKAGGQDSE
ncbi:hypothetical protein ScalyP_jg11226 [Parmales sp. scaly parma]|nr:hypothetical protein ScalyP_jg11226 [Parmales sp. scaly parma]